MTMILSFPPQLWQQVWSILRNNRKALGGCLVWAAAVYGAHHHLAWEGLAIPTSAVAIVGSAMAFFLAFKNNAAYDRWWEARKIWGGVVNVSRTFASLFLSVTPGLDEDERRRVVYRHLAYINAVRVQMRERDEWAEVEPFVDADEWAGLQDKKNKASQLAFAQTEVLLRLKRDKVIDAFEHQKLTELIERLYDLQGMSERIKKTVFPHFYSYFTRVFLLLFVIILPAGLVADMDWRMIPLSVAISFIFIILEKIGGVTEEPLGARSSGTPMNAICRTIEIDLRQMLGETDVPPAYAVKVTRHGSSFLD
jgi:putative membrane protein